MIESVYIHIPFCSDICTYCDFCKYYYNEELVDKYLEELANEIKSNYKKEIIKTIYIGGGTPSSLSLKQLSKLMDIIKIFNTDLKEFTVEVNIENIDLDKIKILKENNVTRISIGIQTFNDKFLKILNRKHTEKMVIDKIKMIKKYFDNINIDLIYAIPGETLKDLESDIEKFIKLDISHISTYSLIIEDNTILKNNHVSNIDDNLDYEMYKLICNRLKDYEHYEISNFGKKKSLHNLVYWNNEHYYGFGLGASGYINNIRYTNTRSINNYLKGKYRYISEELTFNNIIENEFILGFRKIEGININDFKIKYNIDINKIDVVNRLIKDNKLILNNNYLKINPKYIYISNDILIEFMGVDYGKYV